MSDLLKFPIAFELKDTFKYPDILVHIFPTMQKDVRAILDYLSTDERIVKCIVFGSSLTLNCGVFSDIDLGISLIPGSTEADFDKASSRIRGLCSNNVDVLWIDHTKNPLLEQNIQKGFVIYER